MNEVVHFVPKAEAEAAENLRNFISHCRDRLNVFGQVSWDDRAWDISATMRKKAGSGRNALVWEDFNGAALPAPFGNFARAYMCYQHAMRPSTAINSRMAALRSLDKSFRKKLDANLSNASVTDFNRAAEIIRDRFGPESAYRIGTQLQLIADFVDEHQLSSARLNWTNFIKRSRNKNDRVGREADEARANKLPSERALESLGRAFAIAEQPADVLITAVGALLCSAPERINEVLRLPVQCQHHASDTEGNPLFGIRWWPSKGADPCIKWIVRSMSTVAQEAIEKVARLTQEARTIALWYEQNPTKLYLPPDHEDLRAEELVRPVDLVPLLGLSSPNAAQKWLHNAEVPVHMRNGRVVVRFADFERAVVETLPGGFPVFDNEVDTRFSESLFVVPKNFFHSRRGTSRVMVEKVDWGDIANGLGAGVKCPSSDNLGHRIP